ncbi:hypothetical protein [Nocardia wallacei]|uniref:hypothetical protein n=1 Tax=Nocardia wallacei TaxID=480035 RepID=UPI0024571834|nr:hypothetical protein [Nocardia wallacei]
MKFRLKLLWFEIQIETPEPVQVSPTDVVTAVWSAISQSEGTLIMIPEDVDRDEE